MNALKEARIKALEKKLKLRVQKDNRKVDQIIRAKEARVKVDLDDDAILSYAKEDLEDALREYQARAFIISCIESDLAECDIITLREKENLLKVKLDRAKEA